MTDRERFRAICRFEPVDRAPLFYFQGFVGGPVGYEARQRWLSEDLFPPARSAESLAVYFGLTCPELVPIELGMWPPFETEVLDRPSGDTEVVRLSDGTISLQVRDNDNVYAMPQFLEFAVKSRRDWEELKARFESGDHRYPRGWSDLAKRYRESSSVLRLGAGAGYVGGFYGRLRGLLGFERLSLSFHDDPRLLKDMNQFHVDFLISTLDRCLSEVQIDLIVIGEDMAGRNGMLVSPASFREFMLPYYRQFVGFCKEHRVGSVWVDSDGDIRELIPLLVEAGVDGIGPCDNVLGLVDVVALRESYPRLVLAGGIDKRVVEIGRTFDEIDAELERKVRPLLRRGGYFPGPDHGWTPLVSLDNYRYYVDRLRALRAP